MTIPPKPLPITDQFLNALAMVEYSGKGPAPDGDGGRAVGPFQIWPVYRMEANRLLRGPVFSDDDRKSFLASREMARTVLTFWANYHRDRGIEITPEVLCSLHRQPNHRWTPGRMATPLEKGRTRRLRAFMAMKKR